MSEKPTQVPASAIVAYEIVLKVRRKFDIAVYKR